MKRISLYTTTSFLLIFQFFLPFHCYGHGFDGNTLVSIVDQSVDLYPIRLVCEDVVEDGQSIISFDFAKEACVKRTIRSAGRTETDYHVAISFNDEWWEDITCTATQEFYVVHTRQWIPAYQLKIGDILFSKDHEVKRISKIRFFKEPRTVYAIHVKGTHNFFVGTNQILTHNIVLPAISIGLGIAFGTGAAAGGSMGGVLGPITLSCGAILGGLFGIGIKKFFGPADVPCYHLELHTPAFSAHLQKNNDEADHTKRTLKIPEQIAIGECGGSPDPEDPWKNKEKYKKQRWDNAPQESDEKLRKAIEYATNENKLIHFFNKPKHGLDNLLDKMGGKNNIDAQKEIVNQVVTELMKLDNLPKNGEFDGILVNVAGSVIYTRGLIHEGTIKMGTMFIRKNMG